MESLEHSARNLVAHFRAICGDETPLSLDGIEKAEKRNFMDDKAMDFLRELKALVEFRGTI